jgi:hypothetical protein
MPFEKGNEYRFQEGHEGKGGRPKGSTSITAELCKILEKKIVATFPEFAQKPEMAKKKAKEIMAEKMMLDALKGNTMMQMHIHSHVDGKPKQQIDVGGQEDNPIIIRHIRPDVNNE